MATSDSRYQSIPARHLVRGDIVWHKGIVLRVSLDEPVYEVVVHYASDNGQIYEFGEDVLVRLPRPSGRHAYHEFPIGNLRRFHADLATTLAAVQRIQDRRGE
jgi:hypothetical protein